MRPSALTQIWAAQTGAGLALLRTLLLPLSGLYGALLEVRRQLYRLGLYKTYTLPVPVVVVGNVMVGGVGKTPVTIALVQHLTAQGWRVGVLSRGYGRRTTSTLAVSSRSNPNNVGDEPVLIARHCQVPVFVGISRVAAGRALLALHPDVQVLVCDDGLQHWSLHRDLELCVFDERGVGNGHLLPAGPLREAWPRRGQALSTMNTPVPCLVLHTGGQAGPGEFAVTRTLADHAVLADGTQRPLHSWRDSPVQALAGIAKPEAFFTMLKASGLMLAHTLSLKDHADMRALSTHLDMRKGDVLCTEKDAVKLWPNHPQVWAVPLQTALPADLLRTIDQHLGAAHRAKLSSLHGQQTA